MKQIRLSLPAMVSLGAALFLPTIVSATPYWGQAEIEAYYHAPSPGSADAVPGFPSPPPSSVAGGMRADYALMMQRTAAFLALWQVQTPGADFGGIREGEHLPTIIQTDNTSEAIWVWSRYYEWTGDNRYLINIQNAFTYSLSHRAYSEEGGSLPTTGYYRMYNCGWAVRAEQKYRDVYGDTNFKTYGDSCASYIRYHTLNRQGSSFDRYVNPPVLSWALGNLWWAGVHENRPEWTEAAYLQSLTIKGWVQAEPTLLGNETWAMSGGATMWGLINSYFRVTPESTQVWVGRYVDNMDNYSSPGSFQNAWNGWYAYGHRAVGVSLSDLTHLATHVALTDTLIAEDGDHDGGIPAQPPDTDTMDQTWVSNYLAVFGCSELLSGVSDVPLPGTAAPRIFLTSFPNPARVPLDLTFMLPKASRVNGAVYDLAGRRIAGLGLDYYPAGIHSLRWDGRTDAGAPASAGIYWVSLRGDDAVATRRLVLLR